ncbi:MAG: penicillin-binding transpeptidase domain-containing protein [Candidatus Jorgensenbacteria bacterium]
MTKHESRLGIEEMLSDGALEADLMEVPLAPRAFRAFFALAIIFLLLALAQLGYLGVARHDFYGARARANMADEKTVLAPRGIIYDRQGEPLVENLASMNAFLTPRYLPEAPAERLQTLQTIAAALGVDIGMLTEKLAARDWSVSERVPIAEDLSHDRIVELSSRPIPGLTMEPSFKRVHRTPYAFAHLIGYTNLADENDLKNRGGLVAEDQVGRAGLEAFYDEALRGADGRAVTYRDARGNLAEGEALSAPLPGLALRTSIDGELQEFLYQRLSAALRDLGRTVGVGIAMDPRNGEILALVGLPAFDSARVAETLNAPGEPFFNRAISGLYNPGSAIKPVVAVAALAEGVIDPQKQIFSKGYIEIPNPYYPELPSRFVDWKPNGWVNLADALAKSSNIYFYEVGGGFEDQVGLGIERLKRWWEKFNLGSATGVDLVGEAKGFLPDPAWKERETGEPWRIGDTYHVAIGQGDLLVTPLGLLNSISAIANGGVVYRPRVVRAIVDGRGTVMEESATSTVLADLRGEIGNTVSHVQEGMRAVVDATYGTAHSLAGLPFSVAAKTGTAQIEDNSKLNAFFVGYAPAERPQIALLILVENAVQGSLNTVPVARDVFLWYYNHRMKTGSN